MHSATGFLVTFLLVTAMAGVDAPPAAPLGVATYPAMMEQIENMNFPSESGQ